MSRAPGVRRRAETAGYVEAVGWLGARLLWVDGWLAGPDPAELLEIRIELGDRVLEASVPSHVIDGAYDNIESSRFWFLLVPLDRPCPGVSRLESLAIRVPEGQLLWHGSRDRFLTFDLAPRFHAIAARGAGDLSALETKIRRVAPDDERTDPGLARHLRTLRRVSETPIVPLSFSPERNGIHVEEALLCTDALLVSGWRLPNRAEALAIVGEDGDRIALDDRLLECDREDLRETVFAGERPRAFLATAPLPGTSSSPPTLEVTGPDGPRRFGLRTRGITPDGLTARLAEYLDSFAGVPDPDRTTLQLEAVLPACRRDVRLVEPVPLVETSRAPEVSLVLDCRKAPDLLDAAIPEIRRTCARMDREVLLLFGPSDRRRETAERLAGLGDLHHETLRVLFLERGGGWGTIHRRLAEASRGRLLLFARIAALFPEAPGPSPLLTALDADPAVGLVAPTLRRPDGSELPTGGNLDAEGAFHAAGSRSRTARASELPGIEVAACCPEVFAIRRATLLAAGGFAGFAYDGDAELADLARRLRDRGASTRLVASPFTRFDGRADGDRPTTWATAVREHDRRALRRRFEARPRRRRARGGRAPWITATVVIPILDPGPELDEVVERIESQESFGQCELLVLDSGSSERALRSLRRIGARVLDVFPGEFNHGATRQRGAEAARGRFVVFLSQDALPEPGWLEGLLQAFEDPRVAGAYSRQIPRPGATCFVREQLDRWPATSTIARIQGLPENVETPEIPPWRRAELACFDNVSSAVRRSVLRRHPLRDVRFGADRDWAWRVVAAGHRLAYRPDSVVVHSHSRSAWYELRRTFSDHRALRELFPPLEDRPDPSLATTLVVEALRLSALALRSERDGARWRQTLRAPAVAAARVLGARLGRRAADRCPDGGRLWPLLARKLERGI